jgi:RNA polymerase sigma factor for flagellar operon FliA
MVMKRSSRGTGVSGRAWERDEAVESCLPLVKSLAARLRVAHGLRTPFEDLVAAGVVGLLECAERFEPDRGVAFTTFAYRRIRGAILDTQRHEYGGSAGTPTAAPRLSDLMKHRPENTNARPNADPDGQREGWGAAGTTVVPFVSGGDVEESALTPDEEVDRRRQSDRLRKALVALPGPERRILALYYFEGESFSGIGARLGICKPGAFRLHERALEKLREALGVDLERRDASRKVNERALS